MPFLKLTQLPLTSAYGSRTLNGRPNFHKGADFGFTTRMPISACGDGTVIEAGRHPEFGLYVKIDHGTGVATSYHSADEVCAKVGDRVRMGDTVALAGRSAMGATGPHLHLGLWLDGQHVDPMLYLWHGEPRPVREPALTPPPALPEKEDDTMKSFLVSIPADGGRQGLDYFLITPAQNTAVHVPTTLQRDVYRAMGFQDIGDHSRELLAGYTIL